MDSKITRAAAVRQALARRSRALPTAPGLRLLTQYVLGRLTLEQTNEQLRILNQALRLTQPSHRLA